MLFSTDSTLFVNFLPCPYRGIALHSLAVVLVPYCTSIITALNRGVFFQIQAVEFGASQQVSIICPAIGSLSHTTH